MNKERLLQVLVGPHISEKSHPLADAQRQYVFKVATGRHQAGDQGRRGEAVRGRR
jgi:hypothetical protein